MGKKSKGSVLISHDRTPTVAELEAFSLVHTSSRNILLLPVVVNGEQRFALAIACGGVKDMRSMIIGYLAMPEDELMRSDGTTSNPMDAGEGTEKVLH